MQVIFAYYMGEQDNVLTSYPVIAMRCIESLTAFKIPKMEVRASCRSSQPSQPLLYFNNSCNTKTKEEIKHTYVPNMHMRMVKSEST